jgi:hypothetical protein
MSTDTTETTDPNITIEAEVPLTATYQFQLAGAPPLTLTVNPQQGDSVNCNPETGIWLFTIFNPAQPAYPSRIHIYPSRILAVQEQITPMVAVDVKNNPVALHLAELQAKFENKRNPA